MIRKLKRPTLGLAVGISLCGGVCIGTFAYRTLAAQTLQAKSATGPRAYPFTSPTGSSSDGSHKSEDGWVLSWSDEFNQQDGTAPDSSKWSFAEGVGNNGWGNNELEYYTKRPSNVVVQNGTLVITARRETYTDSTGITRNFTSARLRTQELFSQAYGRFEARIRIPAGRGLWPAFWLLGDNIKSVGWPSCGEIDIMENIGKELSTVHGTIHGPGYSAAKGISSAYVIPDGRRFADDFHVFAVEWEPKTIRFYVDSDLYATRTPEDLPTGAQWVYEHPFFILLNLAVGGNWPGPPDATTSFPASMLVDYVRVYQRSSAQGASNSGR
jgi:beta-glucanase (GH16 family)